MSAVSGGLLAFGSVFVEMFFILSSIWQHRFYYVFGFLARRY
jgi:transmembrane 9 superfamily protein 2/4